MVRLYPVAYRTLTVKDLRVSDQLEVEKIIVLDSDGLNIYASDGTTQLFKLDENGNLGLKGRVYTI